MSVGSQELDQMIVFLGMECFQNVHFFLELDRIGRPQALDRYETFGVLFDRYHQLNEGIELSYL